MNPPLLFEVAPGVAGPSAARRDAGKARGVLTAWPVNWGSCRRGALPTRIGVPSYRQPRWEKTEERGTPGTDWVYLPAKYRSRLTASVTTEA